MHIWTTLLSHAQEIETNSDNVSNKLKIKSKSGEQLNNPSANPYTIEGSSKRTVSGNVKCYGYASDGHNSPQWPAIADLKLQKQKSNHVHNTTRKSQYSSNPLISRSQTTPLCVGPLGSVINTSSWGRYPCVIGFPETRLLREIGPQPFSTFLVYRNYVTLFQTVAPRPNRVRNSLVVAKGKGQGATFPPKLLRISITFGMGWQSG